jgi:hypothetical protein
MGAPALIHALMISGLIRPCFDEINPCERAQMRAGCDRDLISTFSALQLDVMS